jgi:cytochrome c-type biogenesis protein CcmH
MRVVPLAPLALILALMLGSGGAWALSDPSEMLANPKLEARAEAIGSGLRCLVCQNESIEASDAPLAQDLRAIIRHQVAAGQSDRQIKAYMVARYGDFILLRPPFDALTALLWATPLLALMLGLAVALLGHRWQRRRGMPPAPLSAAERARLDRLLGS